MRHKHLSVAFNKKENPRKATEPDGTPGKVLLIARNAIDSHLTNTINRDTKENKCLRRC